MLATIGVAPTMEVAMTEVTAEAMAVAISSEYPLGSLHCCLWAAVQGM